MIRAKIRLEGLDRGHLRQPPKLELEFEASDLESLQTQAIDVLQLFAKGYASHLDERVAKERLNGQKID